MNQLNGMLINTVDYYIAVNINHMDMYPNNVKV